MRSKRPNLLWICTLTTNYPCRICWHYYLPAYQTHAIAYKIVCSVHFFLNCHFCLTQREIALLWCLPSQGGHPGMSLLRLLYLILLHYCFSYYHNLCPVKWLHAHNMFTRALSIKSDSTSNPYLTNVSWNGRHLETVPQTFHSLWYSNRLPENRLETLDAWIHLVLNFVGSTYYSKSSCEN